MESYHESRGAAASVQRENRAITPQATSVNRSIKPSEFMNLVREGGHLAGLTATELKVLFVYASRANWRTGDAFPGISSIAHDIGIKNLNQIRRAIAKLEQRGLLQLVRRGGGKAKTNVWRLCVPATSRTPQPKHNADTGSISSPVSPALKRGQVWSANGVGSEAQTGAQSGPRTLNNPKEVHEDLSPVTEGEEVRLRSLPVEERERVKHLAIENLHPWVKKSLQGKDFVSSPTLRGRMLAVLHHRREHEMHCPEGATGDGSRLTPVEIGDS
jgi:hypothetical protein